MVFVALDERRRQKVLETVKLTNQEDSILFKNCSEQVEVYQCHSDYLVKCPNNFIITARSNDNIIEAIESKDKLRFGVQFHPENSSGGKIILHNFTDYCLSLKRGGIH